VGVLGMAVLATSTTVMALAGPRTAVATVRQPGPTDVRRLYLSDCAVCHGAEGRGRAGGPPWSALGGRRSTTS
jgi:Cytochrome c.